MIEEDEDDARFVAGSEEPDDTAALPGDDEGGWSQTPASDLRVLAGAALLFALRRRRAR